MKIIISPYSKKLREKDTPHPKNYPYWAKLIELLEAKGYDIIQVGVPGETPLTSHTQFGLPSLDLIELMRGADLFISVENFFPHMVHYNFKGLKSGIVLFGKSDPEIFGYPENTNLLKNASFLRWDQFGMWENTEYIEEAFVSPEVVLEHVNKFAYEKDNKSI